MAFLRLLAPLLLVVAVVALPRAARADDLSVAAAANLIHVMEPLKAEFQINHPGTHVRVVLGASGNLYAQIAHGAPHHVFMSADVAYPQQLVAAGAAKAESLTVFAVGRLALWSPDATLVAGKTLPEILGNPTVKRLAIANPQTAPYGRAALETIDRLGLADALREKIVTGENITQTVQFVESGNAQLGFVALAHLRSPKLLGKGAFIEIPAGEHRPLDHAAVLTSRGAQHQSARAFITFLRGKEARALFTAAGYSAPSP